MHKKILCLAACCCLFLSGCTGSSPTGTLDTDKADSKEFAVAEEQISIPIGASSDRVLKALGQPDSMENMTEGHVWRYENKRAKYVYVSNADNTSALILGGYAQGNAAGVPLMLRLVLNKGKVTDFNYSQIGF